MTLFTPHEINPLTPIKRYQVQHLDKYHNPGRLSTGRQHSEANNLPPALPVGGSPLLVNTLISQQAIGSKNPVKALHVWPRAIKLDRDFDSGSNRPPPSLRGEISSFSMSSKRRLKFTAGNAFPQLISQISLTYHKATPDGHTVKKHLNTFLTSLRRHFPGVGHLWILEFQKRQTPHLHLFLTLPHSTAGLHNFMASKWHAIAEPDSPEHLRFHRHEKNFIPWDMGTAGYLCKYLDKEHQKQVPQGFIGVGRFWGNSRGLVPDAILVETANIDAAFSYSVVDQDTGEVQEFQATEYVIRCLCKHHEKSLRRSPWKSSARKRRTSYTLPNGFEIYKQLENYLSKQRQPESLPF